MQRARTDAGRRLFTAPCPLCAGDSQSLLLCADCTQRLPWLARACARCAAAPLPQGVTLCGPCVATPPPFHHAVVAFAYAAPIDGLILGLKSGRLSHARLLGELLASLVHTRGEPTPDALIPVPSQTERLGLRGFNPAAELAKIIRDRLGCRLDLRCLSHTGKRAPQTRMRGAERRRLPLKTFVPAHAPPAHVAVIDDVVTTGSTIRAVAAQLKRAGAQRVDVWAVAKTVKPS